MQLRAAIRQIETSLSDMNAAYGRVVFDEWAIVLLTDKSTRLIYYAGSRREGFLKNFASDLAGLREAATAQSYAEGDFEFARHAVGTGFESFMVLGAGLYLICNNTGGTMDMIAKDPKWRAAQVPFANLGERFREDPLTKG
jgi:hypothetical protein